VSGGSADGREAEFFGGEGPPTLRTWVRWSARSRSRRCRSWSPMGGWYWEARGVDRPQASERLEERVGHRHPFVGDPMDWGPPGRATDDRFDESIPVQVQNQMPEYQRALDPNLARMISTRSRRRSCFAPNQQAASGTSRRLRRDQRAQSSTTERARPRAAARPRRCRSRARAAGARASCRARGSSDGLVFVRGST
jgi:hypothetical protein